MTKTDQGSGNSKDVRGLCQADPDTWRQVQSASDRPEVGSGWDGRDVTPDVWIQRHDDDPSVRYGRPNLPVSSCGYHVHTCSRQALQYSGWRTHTKLKKTHKLMQVWWSKSMPSGTPGNWLLLLFKTVPWVNAWVSTREREGHGHLKTCMMMVMMMIIDVVEITGKPKRVQEDPVNLLRISLLTHPSETMVVGILQSFNKWCFICCAILQHSSSFNQSILIIV